MGVGEPMALLLGMTLVGVPVLVHFLARPRPVRLPYSTVRFLREAVKHRRALFRFRDLLVLCLRALTVILLAAAFARLFSRSTSAIALEGEDPTVRVVLLDASQSMQARRSVVQVFDQAKATARKYLRYRPGLKANVLVCAAQTRPLFEQASENLAGLESALASAQPRCEALDVGAALVAAARVFTDAGGRDDLRRELIVISDLQGANWQDAPMEVIPAGVNWRFDQVGLSGEVGNLAVCNVSAARRSEVGSASAGVQLAVDVGNFSDVEQSASLEVRVENSTYRAETRCPSWSSGHSVVEVPGLGLTDAGAGGDADDGPQWLCGTVHLVEARDVLAADDSRPFVVPLMSAHRHVVLSREDPSAVATSRFFLDRALSAGSGRARDPRTGPAQRSLPVSDPAHVHRDVLADADLIILVEAGRLPPETVRLLASLLVRGSSLLYIAEDLRDAENLADLEKALGTQLRLPVTFTAGGRPAGSPRRLDWVQTGELPFRILATKMELLRALEFPRVLGSVQRSGGVPEDVLATFDDGSAALVVTACGRGRLAVLNAGIAESTLPASPLFVPLVQELAARLRQQKSERTTPAVGESLNVFLPASLGGARDTHILGPSGPDGSYGDLTDTETGVLWSWGAVDRPGVYSVVQHDQVIEALAAACPESESDLRCLAAEEMAGGVSDARVVDVRRTSTDVDEEEQRREWWPWLMFSAVCCLLGELGVLKLFRT